MDPERRGTDGGGAASSAAATLDAHVVRGDAARRLAEETLAAHAPAAAQRRAPLKLELISGLGAGKIKALREHVGCKTVEDLAVMAWNVEKALAVTGRSGSSARYAEQPPAHLSLSPSIN